MSEIQDTDADLDVLRLNMTDVPQLERIQFGFSPSDVKAVNEDTREVLHLITTGSRDRMDDMVEPRGAKLANYRKNPVVLVNHDYSVESIIGRAVAIESSEDGLYARTRFRDTPLAEAAYRLTVEKLGGWSIGFRPTKRHTIKQGKDQKCKRCSELFEQLVDGKEPGDFIPDMWGMHFAEWELLEYSSVAIPANQDVVNNAVTRGLCPEQLVSKFFVSEPQTREADASPGDGPTAEADHESEESQEQLRVELAPALASILAKRARREALHAARQVMRNRR